MFKGEVCHFCTTKGAPMPKGVNVLLCYVMSFMLYVLLFYVIMGQAL